MSKRHAKPLPGRLVLTWNRLRSNNAEVHCANSARRISIRLRSANRDLICARNYRAVALLIHLGKSPRAELKGHMLRLARMEMNTLESGKRMLRRQRSLRRTKIQLSDFISGG